MSSKNGDSVSCLYGGNKKTLNLSGRKVAFSNGNRHPLDGIDIVLPGSTPLTGKYKIDKGDSDRFVLIFTESRDKHWDADSCTLNMSRTGNILDAELNCLGARNIFGSEMQIEKIDLKFSLSCNTKNLDW